MFVHCGKLQCRTIQFLTTKANVYIQCGFFFSLCLIFPVMMQMCTKIKYQYCQMSKTWWEKKLRKWVVFYQPCGWELRTAGKYQHPNRTVIFSLLLLHLKLKNEPDMVVQACNLRRLGRRVASWRLAWAMETSMLTLTKEWSKIPLQKQKP